MCGILFTNKDISSYDIEQVLFFLTKRGPDKTNVQHINNFTFVHTLLSMTGPLTVQPFYNTNKSVICMFNGEIYNFKEFGNYFSDGECLIPLYEKYGTDFIHKLDGEFAIVLLDLKENKLIFSTDIFSTRPLWIAFDDQKHIGISTYKSCLDRIDLTNNFQILANKTYVLDINNMKIIQEKRVHTFDLKQYKNNLHDWNKAFSNSIKKRTQYAKCGIFIGMSGGYDSGAIACELHKQNIEFSAYSICNVEDKQVMKERSNIIKNSNLIELGRKDFLQARDFLKKNAEEYLLNIDNGEVEQYLELIKKPNYSQNNAEQLLKTINFRKNGQTVTDDNGAIGCSHVCSLAKQQNEKIYLSGSGADEIFSDYGFKGIKYFDHSTIGGHFPDNLSDVFPWKNFFRNTQRSYLMKEEHVAGAYGIEGRYPFLDKYVVQEFLWLLPELKNKEYKYPLDQYLTLHNFPYEKEQKTGFGCGFAGPNPNGIHFQTLTKEQKQALKNRKVTDHVSRRKVDFDKLMLRNTKSYENFYIINKEKIRHDTENCYIANISINFPGLKYYDKSRFVLLENNKPLQHPVTSHNLIRTNGKGKFCFWTSKKLYFSTSDNSDPRTNNKTYSIITLNNNLRKLSYKNINNFNGKKYYIKIIIKNCKYNTHEYFKIREIFNFYNFIPNILICDNFEIFMDLPNIKFCKFNDTSNYDSRVTINNVLNTDINNIREKLFHYNMYDNDYTIYKGTKPKITINIFTINNNQFMYALESALRQDIDCIINIIKNLSPCNALNAMIDRCQTNYTIQMDEDMIFFDNNSAKKMYNKILECPQNTWQYCYALQDLNFGITNSYHVLGMKIFNIKLMKKYKLKYSSKNSFAIDRSIQEITRNKGLKNLSTSEKIGHHQKNFSPWDLFLRTAKIGHEICSPLSISNNIYEFGIVMKYLTAYSYNDLIQTILYIINKCKKNPKVFFDKINIIKIPKCFLSSIEIKQNYHININNFDYIDRLKNTKEIPTLNSLFIPKKNVEYYCISGIIYSFYFKYEYNLRNYPIKWFNEFIL